MDNQNREAFEAWAREYGYPEGDLYSLGYEDYEKDLAWKCWQAATAHTAAECAKSYAKGAADMRERAAKTCEDRLGDGCTCGACQAKIADARKIRALTVEHKP